MPNHRYWGQVSRGARRRDVVAAWFIALWIGLCLSWTGGSVSAQVINEIIADNNSESPADIEGGHPDMLEIYNDTEESLTLGQTLLADTYYLQCVPATQDPPEFIETEAWPFPPGRSAVGRNSRLIVFLDGNESQGTCELHASFTISSNGSEAIVLWGPEQPDQTRQVVDRIYLPPTPANVAWGRYPDGAGGPNLSLEEHGDFFVRYPPGESSFGGCAPIPGICLIPGLGRRHCTGAPNSAPDADWNLPPRITRLSQSSNAPAAGEAVEFVARVRDDKDAIPENLSAVEIVYRVKQAEADDFGPEQAVDMAWDSTVSETGILTDKDSPLDRFTHWQGSIPGQPAGARVEFYFRVVDDGGLVGIRPTNLCHLIEIYGEGVGPCDREFGPEINGCVKDENDITCVPDDSEGTEEEDGGGEGIPAGALVGERFVDCNVRSTYTVGYEPRAAVAGLVINEIVASQTDLLTDHSEPGCNVPDVGMCTPEVSRCCESTENPDCCRRDEDFAELYNTSSEDIDVSGLFLSDGPFDPQRWAFPPGSIIPARTRVIIWLDRDGSRCPNNAEPDKPCFWECPDPNFISMQQDPPEFHTNFGLDADGDQLYLFDNEDNGFGLIHGFDFGDPKSICGFEPVLDENGDFPNDLLPNQSLSLVPDGDRNGTFVITDNATPREQNAGVSPCEVGFKRGDASGDGGVDISDGVFILNHLFLGSAAPSCPDSADSDDNGVLELTDAVRVLNFLFLGGPPPPEPGPNGCGSDPSDDSLPACIYNACDAG